MPVPAKALRCWAYCRLRCRDSNYLGRRRNVLLLLIVLVTCWSLCWRFAIETSKALIPPPPPIHYLQHFRRNQNLQHYIDNIPVLITPSRTPCNSDKNISVVVLVASTPLRFKNRQAIRQTWAKYQPTYFLLGLHGYNVDEDLVDNYAEAKQYSDIIVFKFREHYQNLTLKTALMIKWTLDNCPQAQFFYKTDDDVMINPWKFRKVLKEHVNSQLVGYQRYNRSFHRDEYVQKWYIPRWLYHEDNIDTYLAGAGYLINGKVLPSILEKAYQVPLINLEDIYFTYLVAYKALGLNLTHDARLRPFQTWVRLSCIYWHLASVHGFEPHEMLSTWSRLLRLTEDANSENVCSIFDWYFDESGDSKDQD